MKKEDYNVIQRLYVTITTTFTRRIDPGTQPTVLARRYILHRPMDGFQIPKSGKILLVESGILCFGIHNTVKGIRNLTNYWSPQSKFY